MARWVWMPYRASAGTSLSPSESCSRRMSCLLELAGGATASRRRPRRCRTAPPAPQISRAAASTSAAWPVACTFRKTLRTVPSASIRKVVRLATPTMRARHAEGRRNRVVGVAEQRERAARMRSANFRLALTGSTLAPITCTAERRELVEEAVELNGFDRSARGVGLGIEEEHRRSRRRAERRTSARRTRRRSPPAPCRLL